MILHLEVGVPFMKKFILKRLLSNLISLWVMFSLTFWIMKAIPGDPFSHEDGNPLSIETVANLKKQCGLDEPLSKQYLKHLVSVLTFDFGNSLVYRDRSVKNIISSSFSVSAILGIQSSIVSIAAGLLLGWLSAVRTNGWLPKIIEGGLILQLSLPGFIAAILLQYFFAFKFHLFPVACWGSFSHTILPTLALASVPTAFIAKLAKDSFSSVMNKDYVLLARAKGLPQSGIILKYILPQSVFPTLSYLNFMIANVVTGTFAVENIFGIPGLGKWFTQSVLQRDYPVIIGLTVFYGTFFIIISWIIELIQARIDPQIRKNF